MEDWMRGLDVNGRSGPGAWGVSRLEVVEGGPRRDWLAESRYATLEYRERELQARERRLTIRGYAVACFLALEVILALVVVGWGNHRLELQARPAVGARR